MRRHIARFLNTPKVVAGSSLIVALVIGGISFHNHNKKPAGQFTEADSQALNEESNTPADTTVRNISLGFLSGGRIKTVSVKVGDSVKKGQILASIDAQNTAGALTQSRAAYKAAKANYERVINGATGPTIDVAKAAVNTAKVNLEQVTNQQNALVTNARRKMYSDDLVVNPENNFSGHNPVITGNYNGDTEGDYFLSFKNSNLIDVKYTGLENGVTEFDTLPRPLGQRGLMIAFPLGLSGYLSNDTWVLHIPNKSGANYTANLNAYQLALQNKIQAIASAQSALDQAQASLASLAATARPEDVASAQAQISSAAGALQIANAAYGNTTITAPGDGTITAVYISLGQIATPNTAAIQFLGLSN